MLRLATFLAILLGAGTLHADAEPGASTVWLMGGPRLGIQVQSMTQELRQFFGAPATAGVLVGKVDPDGAGAKAGLRVGDVVVEAGGQPVDSADDITRVLTERKEGETITLQVRRERAPITLQATVPKSEDGAWGGKAFTRMMPRGSLRWSDPVDGLRFLPDLEKRLEALEKRLEALEKRR